ncbi:GH25 family lysozyme [Lacrimispora celerecrescens]|uniref:Glycoside hydrolase n=1 Tax=Lacrimispora celerecrescens TaxID=29354 RepID=A0A084JRJ0_9FIRM|nr:GH25 family lysozyme [Lacrimispora celerecrescens]KEZ91574.1 glycoside hydrolase [Lacrimispora celerecrescens]
MRHKKLGIRFAAAALCALMGMSAGFGPAMNSWAAGYEKVNGYYQLANGTVIEQVIARGIDVSRWQGNVNWAAVAADDVSFVMLGTRSKGIVDPYFHTNVQGASAAGLKVGAYIYSLATTPDMAREEADFVLSLVKDYPISFPIAFDAEDSATLGTLPPAQVSEIINAFCQRIADAGYYPIVYANDYWLSNKIDLSNMHYDVWVARYEAKHVYSNPIMWQVTSTGSINGINGNVDIDFLYKDLTPKLPGNMWRTIGGKTYYYQNYAIQKNTWVNDGSGWFYMNEEGLTATGWFDKDGLRYYLDETSGRMNIGWKQLSDKWYFFNPSGSMNTGWLTDNGARYYLGSDGTMATGWQELNGQYYYLDPSSGKMATGWKNINDKWYFLQESGVMSTGWLDNNGARYYLNNDGSMVTGWHTDGTSKYYLAGNGAVSTGWQLIDNSWYFFNQTGAMTTGWINPDGSWYYIGNDGKMQSGWLEERGAKYYLSTSSGKMTVGWRQVDGSWYYFGGSGAMATGMTQVGGQQYYLNPADGKMAASATFVLDGVSYTADANGVCTVTPQTAAEQPEGESTAESQAGQAGTETAPIDSSTNQTKEIGPGIH